MHEISDVNHISESHESEKIQPNISIKPFDESDKHHADAIYSKLCEDRFGEQNDVVEEKHHGTDKGIRIENPKELSLTQADEVFDGLFDFEEENNDASNNETDESKDSDDNKKEMNSGEKGVYSDLKTMKSELGKNYGEIKADKPPNSPNIAKWFENGGSIKIQEKEGKQEWTYIDKDGREVKYVDGYPVFPPEAKHPVIGDISIGEFTGDRNQDKKLYLEKLEEEYGLTEIPEGYALHHDSTNGNLQLVKLDWHKEFTHAGGHSLFKEEE